MRPSSDERDRGGGCLRAHRGACGDEARLQSTGETTSRTPSVPRRAVRGVRGCPRGARSACARRPHPHVEERGGARSSWEGPSFRDQWIQRILRWRRLSVPRGRRRGRPRCRWHCGRRRMSERTDRAERTAPPPSAGLLRRSPIPVGRGCPCRPGGPDACPNRCAAYETRRPLPVRDPPCGGSAAVLPVRSPRPAPAGRSPPGANRPAEDVGANRPSCSAGCGRRRRSVPVPEAAPHASQRCA